MDFLTSTGFSTREREQFTAVCNRLLGSTFIFKELLRPDGKRVMDPDYSFLLRYAGTVQDYLSVIGWQLNHAQHHGYYYVLNELEANRCLLSPLTTKILLTLRLLYEEESERAGMSLDVTCHVRDILEKLVTTLNVLKRPNMDEFKKSLRQLEDHAIVMRLEGKYSEAGCELAILPTVLTAVSPERLNALVQELQKEEEQEESGDEETTEDTAD